MIFLQRFHKVTPWLKNSLGYSIVIRIQLADPFWILIFISNMTITTVLLWRWSIYLFGLFIHLFYSLFRLGLSVHVIEHLFASNEFIHQDGTFLCPSTQFSYFDLILKAQTRTIELPVIRHFWPWQVETPLAPCPACVWLGLMLQIRSPLPVDSSVWLEMTVHF